MGDMLQDGGNRWRGMLFGMTARLPWPSADPRPVWKVWDEFGIGKARMRGWWEKDCPVRTGREDVLATAYVKPGKTLVALASWAPATTAVRLQIDWKALGLEREQSPARGAGGEGLPTGQILAPGRADHRRAQAWLADLPDRGPLNRRPSGRPPASRPKPGSKRFAITHWPSAIGYRVLAYWGLDKGRGCPKYSSILYLHLLNTLLKVSPLGRFSGSGWLFFERVPLGRFYSSRPSSRSHSEIVSE